jgi:hypothetical protein
MRKRKDIKIDIFKYLAKSLTSEISGGKREQRKLYCREGIPILVIPN